MTRTLHGYTHYVKPGMDGWAETFYVTPSGPGVTHEYWLPITRLIPRVRMRLKMHAHGPQVIWIEL